MANELKTKNEVKLENDPELKESLKDNLSTEQVNVSGAPISKFFQNIKLLADIRNEKSAEIRFALAAG